MGLGMFLMDPSAFLGSPGCSGAAAPRPPPDAVDGLHSVAQSATAVTVAWRPPFAHNLSIVHYEVQSDRVGSGQYLIESKCPGLAHQCAIDGLRPSQIVMLRVRAYSAEGPGNFSEPHSFASLPSSSPRTPASLRVAFQGATVVALRWDASPVCSTPADVTTYNVQVATAPPHANGMAAAHANCSALPTSAWAHAPSTGEDASLTTQHVSRLSPLTRYCVRVDATNAIGSSGWSAPVLVQTSCTDVAPPLAPGAPNVSVGSDSATLLWNAPPRDACGAQVSHYDARCVPATGAAVTVQTSARTVALHGLRPATAYECAVRAYNAAGSGAWSANANVSTQASQVPTPPGQLSSGAGGNPSLVTWVAPSDTRGATVTAYELQTSNWWQSASNTTSLYVGAATQYEIQPHDPILPDCDYTLKVRAWSAVGPSAWSAPHTLHLDPAGSCGNSADVHVLHDQRSTISSSVSDAILACVIRPASTKPTCIAQHLASSTHMSEACGICWGNDGVCIQSSCLRQCVLSGNPHGAECIACSLQHCTPPMLACAGLPNWCFPAN